MFLRHTLPEWSQKIQLCVCRFQVYYKDINFEVSNKYN